MKIAIAQLNPIIGDLVGNAAAIEAAATEADQQEATLLLTPELSLCGYPPRDLLLDPSFVDAAQTVLEQLATRLPVKLHVLVGTTQHNQGNRAQGGKPLFNSIVHLHNGKIQQCFHKHLLPTYDVFDEDRYFEPGHQPNVLDLKEGKIGVTICEDLWNNSDFWGERAYAVDPVAELMSYNVDLIINLSASPFCVGKQELREAMLRHHAQQYHCPLIYGNQVGGNDDLIFDGRSLAVNRQGEVVGRAHGFAPDLLFLTYNAHDLLPSRIEPALSDSNAEIWSALVLGIRDYAQKCGFSQAVLGLSGGIDSSLVAAIAAAALGPDNVLGVLMPSPYSSDHSIQDAENLADNLGMPTTQLAIATAMQTYDQILGPVFAGTEPGVAEENIQARIRGNLLMAIANKFGRLLISTGNKSEMAVGYCTLYGDMNGGLAAIADVPKTRVYELCQWLNTHTPPELGAQKIIIPASVLTKPPSAELKPGQVDQDSLPPYEVLDDILYRYVDNHQSSQQIIAAGHPAAIVDRIIQMVKQAEFKRRQAPPGLKITDRAFGSGWRMPIAARLTMRPENRHLEGAET
ncbi:NAD+ synthase [Acaryochloris sp. IP29b_bin.137]|uniref:NAD+ synthase n=1 Tax=Acaryochloris sp. IP29b_bin.137 TaxID=2969217 RepID=UPI00262798D0|nr:NAD+ synthase [Acaryochloris sp. IP29b_bin.137]